VLDKIELEDYKVREYFPLKLFEILEEKLYNSKELPVITLLAQTRYFKKLLDQTYTLRRNTARLRDADEFGSPFYLTDAVVEQSMQEIGSFIDSTVHRILLKAEQVDVRKKVERREEPPLKLLESKMGSEEKKKISYKDTLERSNEKNNTSESRLSHNVGTFENSRSMKDKSP
jgi:hypothetical protein